MKATKNNILEYLNYIKPQIKENGIEKLALFGSFARDENGVYSDIDIAISKKENFLKNSSSYDYFKIINNIKSKIKQQFHRNVDVLDLDSNSIFKNTISKDIIYV